MGILTSTSEAIAMEILRVRSLIPVSCPCILAREPFLFTYIHVHMHIRTHVCMNVYTYCTHTYVHIYMYVCMIIDIIYYVVYI